MSGQIKEVSVQYQVGCHSCDSVDSVEGRMCPPGYKQTEVGIIPDGWDIVELSEAVDFLDGLRKPVKAGDREKMRGDYRYYDASGVVDYVNDYLFDGSYILLGEDGENILSRNLPLAFRVNGKFWVNNHAHVMQPKNGFDIDYLTAFLESLDYSLLNSGTAQPKLNKQSCLSVKVAKPTKSEQTGIANTLSDVDALITSLEKLIAKKRAIKTAAMQQLLTGKKRLPPFDLTHTGYKQTELGEIPEDWEVSVLEEAVNFNNGSAHENHISEYGEYTVVNSKFISTEGVVAKYSNQIFCPTKKGNVLMVMSDVPNGRAIAKCFLVDEDNKYTINQRVCSLEPKKVDSKYLFYILNRNKFYLKFDDGVKQTNLRRQDVLECPFPMPSMEEQVAISNALLDMNKEIDALEQRLNKTQQLKQGMMQELLTGRTRLI